MCYEQKCKVVSLNLAHPVYIELHDNRNEQKTVLCICVYTQCDRKTVNLSKSFFSATAWNVYTKYTKLSTVYLLAVHVTGTNC